MKRVGPDEINVSPELAHTTLNQNPFREKPIKDNVYQYIKFFDSKSDFNNHPSTLSRCYTDSCW